MARWKIEHRCDVAKFWITEHDLGRGDVRCSGRNLPTINRNGDCRRNLTRVADHHVALRHVAQREKVCPCHLPGFVNKQEVVKIDDVDKTELRDCANDDAWSVWKELLVGNDLDVWVEIGWWHVRSGREANHLLPWIAQNETPTQIVNLVVRLRRNRDTKAFFHRRVESLEKVVRLA